MAIFDFGNSSILFWPSCYSSAVLSEKASNYRKILKKLAIKVSSPDEFFCCGGFLINAGYDKEARKIARENFDSLKSKKVKKIITTCPLCFYTFKSNYPKMLPDWDIDTEFILKSILEAIKSKINLNEIQNRGKIVYHDSCYLGRYSKVYDEPRELLNLLGYEIVELLNNKEESLCSGSCGNLKQTNPEMANKICQGLIEQIEKTGIKKIVIADPQDYIHLKENIRGTDIEVLDFSDLLCDALNINR